MGQFIHTQLAIGLQSLPVLRWPALKANEERFFLEAGAYTSVAYVSDVSRQPLHAEQMAAIRFALSLASLSRCIAMHATSASSFLQVAHTATLELPIDLHLLPQIVQMSLPKYDDIMRLEPDLEIGQK